MAVTLAYFRAEMERLIGNPAACKFLLAVSGGADSSVMASLFHQAGYSFTVAHCNFHLRGADSDRDMRFVRQMADNMQVPIRIREFDTLTLQKNSGLSIEMMARKLRYEWFNELIVDFDYLVTAHQANDAAETLLLNLCRGTGLHGLTSIPEQNGKVIRPLLSFTATEIRDYAQQNNIQYVTDYTNTDEQIKRNKIRGSVIPLLETINPDLIHTFAHNRAVFAQQWQFLEHQMAKYRQLLLRKRGSGYSIDADLLNIQEDKELILFELLQEFNFTSDTVKALCSQESLQTGKEFRSATHRLVVNRGQYLIDLLKPTQKETVIIHSLKALADVFHVELCANDGHLEFSKDNKILYVDQDKLRFPLTLRYWQAGDYFYPLGGKGKQKLSDFFNDHKINKVEKTQIPILCIKEDIVWIVGYRSDDRYKIDPQHTNNYFKISYYENL